MVCDNYSEREAISFNENGFIGIAGWADSENTRPIIRAFKYWCASMNCQKQIIEHKKEALTNIKERITTKIIKNGMKYGKSANEVTNNE